MIAAPRAMKKTACRQARASVAGDTMPNQTRRQSTKGSWKRRPHPAASWIAKARSGLRDMRASTCGVA